MLKTSSTNSSVSLLISVASTLLAGCSQGEGARVTGTAKLRDGSPLVNARITVRSDETGDWASGVTDQQGQFTLGTETPGEPLPPGKYSVIVVEDRGDWDHPEPKKISPKYGDSITSGFQLVIDSTEDKTLDLVLDPP